jgi:predicted RNA-binding Zn-ribbon protein involved in translation (DUF1610 family)
MALVCGGVLLVRPAANANRWALTFKAKVTQLTLVVVGCARHSRKGGNMPFQDKIAHAAAVTKWKADQQMRLLKSQSRIAEIESQIRNQKAALADKALTLYAQGQLLEEDLKQICDTIASLHEQIKEQHSLQEAIRSERPPEQQVYTSTYPPTQSANLQPESMSGLVCPQCGRALVGRFCPEHGVEGITPSQNSESTPVDNSGAQMVCPKCGRPLTVRFCPEHGVEGIPQQKLHGG